MRSIFVDSEVVYLRRNGRGGVVRGSKLRTEGQLSSSLMTDIWVQRSIEDDRRRGHTLYSTSHSPPPRSSQSSSSDSLRISISFSDISSYCDVVNSLIYQLISMTHGPSK
jgi:hypothetical protein